MTQFSHPVLDLQFLADIDFSTCGQYRFVIGSSTVGNVELNTAAGGSVLGVLQNNPDVGEPANVRVLGTTLLSVDSASAPSHGKYLKSGSDGQGLCYESITASVYGVAIALNNVSSGSGVLIETLLLPQGIVG